jgi:hypothetical protein
MYKKIKEIDKKVAVCITTADYNYLQNLKESLIEIDKMVLYKPIFLKDLKNKIDSLLLNEALLKN